MGRFGPDIGDSAAAPQRSRRPFGIPGNRTSEFECPVIGWGGPWTRPFHFNDFLASAAHTAANAGIGSPDVFRDSSPVGTPTFAQRADIANGVFRATLDATSEIQVAGVDWADQRMIPANKGWLFEAFVALPAALAAKCQDEMRRCQRPWE